MHSFNIHISAVVNINLRIFIINSQMWLKQLVMRNAKLQTTVYYTIYRDALSTFFLNFVELNTFDAVWNIYAVHLI